MAHLLLAVGKVLVVGQILVVLSDVVRVDHSLLQRRLELEKALADQRVCPEARAAGLDELFASLEE